MPKINKTMSDVYEKINNINLNDYKEESIDSIEDTNNYTVDIEVKDNHQYILANGIVSHNTTSMVAGVSSGVEPIFAPVYKRRYNVKDVLHEELVMDSLFAKHIAEGKDLDIFVGAYDITPEDHLAVQSTVQQFIDASISKCVELKSTMILINDKIYYLDELFDKKEDDTFYKINDSLVTNTHTNKKSNITKTYYNGKKPGIKITFDDKSYIVTTFNHKIYVENNRWKKAIHLNIGDKIIL